MNVVTRDDLAESDYLAPPPELEPHDHHGWAAFTPVERWSERRFPSVTGRSLGRGVVFAALAVTVVLASNVASANTTTTAPPETTVPAEETTVPAETSTPPADETDSTDTTDGEQSDTTAADGSDPAAPTTAPPEQTTTEAPSETTPAQPATDEEREQLQAAESAKAREVDAANVRLGVLTEALAVLQQDVEAQTAEVEIATRRLETAEAGLVAVNEDVAELEQTVVDLEIGLSNQAIRSFKGELLDTALIEVGRNPNQAMRMAAMLAKATESDIDFVNELAGAREVLLGRRADVERAALAAEESRQASQVQLAALEEDQQAQLALTFAAEDRLDHLLSERATLARLGADYNQSADEAALVQQLASAPAPAPTTQTSTGAGISTVTEADIRLAGNGIEVHVDIVEDIRQLLADAAADGVELAGGGYRDSAGQIRARRANCGTSNYAIYEMPSSQCSPPTARPGRSMHEQGKAIDFTYNGQLIRSRSGAGWNWLVANAAKYGLFNLPSEPWHWSTNGR